MNGLFRWFSPLEGMGAQSDCWAEDILNCYQANIGRSTGWPDDHLLQVSFVWLGSTRPVCIPILMDSIYWMPARLLSATAFVHLNIYTGSSACSSCSNVLRTNYPKASEVVYWANSIIIIIYTGWHPLLTLMSSFHCCPPRRWMQFV